MIKCLLLLLTLCVQLNAGIEKYFRKIENKSGNNSIPNIDYIYMINLDQRPEKYKQSMDALMPYGIVPYRFSAVNGWQLTFDAMNELGIIYEEKMPHGPIATVFRHENDKEYLSYEIMKEVGVAYYCHSLSRGAIGCTLSHLSILQDAYDSEYETIWIMEDDVRVVSNPLEFSFLIEELDALAPDWDVLFTDNEIKGANGTRVPCMVIRPRPNFEIRPLAYYLERKKISENFTKIGMRFGSASMILRRSGMKKLLDYFKTYKLYFPYDIDYFICPDIKLYMCNRDIVTNIAGGISDNAQPTYKEN